MARDRAFTFHMCIPCGKTFSLVPRSVSRSNIKVTFKRKWPLRGHQCFTNILFKNVFKVDSKLGAEGTKGKEAAMVLFLCDTK